MTKQIIWDKLGTILGLTEITKCMLNKTRGTEKSIVSATFIGTPVEELKIA